MFYMNLSLFCSPWALPQEHWFLKGLPLWFLCVLFLSRQGTIVRFQAGLRESRSVNGRSAVGGRAPNWNLGLRTGQEEIAGREDVEAESLTLPQPPSRDRIHVPWHA